MFSFCNFMINIGLKQWRWKMFSLGKSKTCFRYIVAKHTLFAMITCCDCKILWVHKIYMLKLETTMAYLVSRNVITIKPFALSNENLDNLWISIFVSCIPTLFDNVHNNFWLMIYRTDDITVSNDVTYAKINLNAGRNWD